MAQRRKSGSKKTRQTAEIRGTKTLKKRYEAALRKYKRRELDRQALDLAINEFSFGPPTTTFKHLEFNEIYTKGITRKVKGKTVRYKGKEAIEVQIRSLRRESDSSIRKERFIDNYTKAMFAAGYSRDMIMNVRATLAEMSADEITRVIDRDILPEINFMYSEILASKQYSKLVAFTQGRNRLTSEEKSAKDFYKKMLTEREDFFKGLNKK